jgi:hypothetical protein
MLSVASEWGSMTQRKWPQGVWVPASTFASLSLIVVALWHKFSVLRDGPHASRFDVLPLIALDKDVYVAALIGLVCLARFTGRVAVLSPLVLVPLSTLYVCDVITLLTTNQRFTISGVGFALEFSKAALDLVPWDTLETTLCAGLATLILYRLIPRIRGLLAGGLSLVVAGLSVAGTAARPVESPEIVDRYSFSVRHLVWLMSPLEAAPQGGTYSPQVVDAAVRNVEEGARITAAYYPRKTIIVLIESFSAFHSKLTSEISDYAPLFDTLASQGTLYTNFFAAAPNTNYGMAALLSGVPAISAPGYENNPYYILSARTRPSPVMQELRARGVHTIFISGYPVAMATVKPNHLAKLQVAETRFPPLHAHEEDRLLSAQVPSDAEVYSFAFERVQQLWTPFLMLVEPPEGHKLWGGSTAQGTAVEELLRQLDSFIDNLRRVGFFEEGVLLITSDQRTVRPFSKPELARYDGSAPFRIPLLAIGQGVTPGAIDHRCFSQRDLISKLPEVLYSSREVTNRIVGVSKFKDPSVLLFEPRFDPLCRKPVPLNVTSRGIIPSQPVDGDLSDALQELHMIRAWGQR